MKLTYTFPASHRLQGKEAFAEVYEAGIKQILTPLRVHAKINALGHWRMGISISRSAGNAVRRNRIKRLLREAFRFIQHDLPGSYDLIVVVRPHKPMELPEYKMILQQLADRVHSKPAKR